MKKRKPVAKVEGKADLLLTADWHLRDDQPECRTDDFWSAQEKKVKFITQLAEKHNCPILLAGDLFHKAKSSQFLEQWAIKNLPLSRMTVIPGNHDLPYHNLKNIEDSSIGVLSASGLLVKQTELAAMALGIGEKVVSMGMIHKFVLQDKPAENSPFNYIGYTEARSIMKKYQLDLIVTGDNHQSFVYIQGTRFLVNPGSITRQSADQADHIPKVYLYYASKNMVKEILLPADSGVVTREHLAAKEARDSRLEAFVERLNKNYEIGLSFENNIKSFFKKNKTDLSVQNITWECIQHE